MNRSIHDCGSAARIMAWLKWWLALVFVAAFAVMDGTCAAQALPGEIPAADPLQLNALVLTPKFVQEYFEKFSDLTCKESVRQIVLNNSGHAIYGKTRPTIISLKRPA